jgi:polyhydroxyalkanoate synthesis regulator phasin
MFKKILLGRREYKVVAGIGLLSMTREIAEAGVSELIECGEVKPKDAKGIVDSLVQRSEEQKQAIREMARTEIEQALHDSNFATKEDLEKLSKKIDALAKQSKKG